MTPSHRSGALTQKPFLPPGKLSNLVRLNRQQSVSCSNLGSAATLEFLRSPPGNCLESLRGSRASQYSIRINVQWRICFTWTNLGPDNVEIVDYH